MKQISLYRAGQKLRLFIVAIINFFYWQPNFIILVCKNYSRPSIAKIFLVLLEISHSLADPL